MKQDLPETGLIGIYWLYQGDLFAVFSQTPANGDAASTAVDSTFSHWHEWEVLRHQGRLRELPPELRSEYDSIPRGRVVYRFQPPAFVILHGSVFDQAVRGKIADAFDLGGHDVTDEWDEHYDPLPEDFSFHSPW
jgi:hypothetical protein